MLQARLISPEKSISFASAANFSTLTSSYPHTLHQTIAKVKLLGPGAHVFGAKTQRRLLLVPVRPSGRLWPLRQVR